MIIAGQKAGELSHNRLPCGGASLCHVTYEVNSLLCLKRQGEMKIIAFLTEYSGIDKIIDHPKLEFFAEKPPRQMFSSRPSS